MRRGILFVLTLALCACGGEDAANDACGCGDYADACGCGDLPKNDRPPDPAAPPAKSRNTHMQYGPTAVDAQVAAVATEDEKLRGMAIMSLPSNPQNFEEHPELLGKVRTALLEVALNDSVDMNRAVAIGKLAEMGEHAAPAMPQMVKLLDHPTDCQHFCYNLRHLGKTGLEALPRMIELLQGDDDRNRVHIIDGLGHFGADAAPAVDALAGIVRSDKKTFNRIKAARALGKIGAPAKSALPLLDEVSASGPGNLKFACKEAAAQIRKS